MKVEKVTKVGKFPVYDISVQDAEHYALKNGAVTHNTGVMYSADTVWVIGRQQDKDGTELTGYNFIINIEKSRFVREKSKIPITVSFEGGIQKYSGLLDIAMEAGLVKKPSPGWYQKEGSASKVRFEDTQTEEFWGDMLNDTVFQEFIRKRYEVAYGSILPARSTEEDSE